jgi:hypothetical protein
MYGLLGTMSVKRTPASVRSVIEQRRAESTEAKADVGDRAPALPLGVGRP